MKKGRGKQEKKRRNIISREQMAQDKLIQISVMPQSYIQINEDDLFLQKLEPKYPLKTQQSYYSRTSPARKLKTSTSLYQPFSKKTANEWYETAKEEEVKFNGLRNTLNISKVQIVCCKDIRMSKLTLNHPNANWLEHIGMEQKPRKSKTRRHFSHLSLKVEERCESMRSRLKKGVNGEVVTSFQVKNIPLKHRFQKYVKQYQITKLK